MKLLKDLGPYLVNEKNRGRLTDKSAAIVMDNTVSRLPQHFNKRKINYFITENPSLFLGLNTVAVFKITKRHGVAL